MLSILSRYPTFQVFLAGLISLALTLVIAPLWIRLLRNRGIGQNIREDGPTGHIQKLGTPTMGGLLIVLTGIFSYLIIAKPWINIYLHQSLLVLFTTVACGFIGFIDDWAKVKQKRSLGLKARHKLLLELLISLSVTWVAIKLYDIKTSVLFPIINLTVDLGPFYYLLVFLIIAGASNAVNLTDGLDGLAAGTVMIVIAAFMAIAFRQGHLDIALFAGAISGGCIGLLWYNAYPANIFMGDTGSLALGGAIASLAIVTKTELFLVIIGGIFVAETLSVIIQVASYRFFGRRVFKMAPIHHHFELLGWSETTIMIRFWIVTAVFAGAGFGLYFVSQRWT